MSELLHTYYKTSFNFMTVCMTFLVIYPSYLENFRYKYAFLTICVSYGVSRIQWIQNRDENCAWALSSWLKLLGLTARLGLTCSSLGYLLTSYQGSENVTYHLFPQIPWVMPVTVPLALTIFIALGLQPSSVTKLIFDSAFGLLLTLFLAYGIFEVYTESNTIKLELNVIEKVPSGMLFFLSQFIMQPDGRCFQRNSKLSLQFWLCLLVMGILAFLNEKVACNGLGSCLKHFYGWYEPLFLGLSVFCLGLSTVDFFVAASDQLRNMTEFQEICSTLFRKPKLNSTFLVGLLSISLVYFYTSTMLIILDNSSILLALSFDNLHNLYLLVNNSKQTSENDISGNKYKQLNQNESIDLALSDDDSCSDIDAIVEEYRSQIQVVSGLNLATDIYLKRASYIFRLILTTITVCSILISLALQSKLYKFGISMAAATVILIFLLQWATNTVNSMILKPKTSIYCQVLLYTINTFLIGFIPSSVWLCIIIWIVKGVIIKIALISFQNIRRRKEFVQFFSIREVPPVFGTSCMITHEEKKPKIISRA